MPEWLAQEENIDSLSQFNTFMEGHRGNSLHWADLFPGQERLLNGMESADTPLSHSGRGWWP